MNESFTIFPAIDLRRGQVVRLQHGDPQRQTVFGPDPLAVARRWAAAGAEWLHVVNLDGAFAEGGATNWKLLPQLAGVGPPVQFGGGMRSLDDVRRALDAGAARVILGTVAVEDPDVVARSVEECGAAHVVVALDARDGVVRTRGWQTDSGLTATELGRRMADLGVTTVLHTDISRDGILAGVNARASAALAQETGLRVIASGGISSLDDVLQAWGYADQGLAGVITGRALYEGKLDLAQAIQAVAGEAPGTAQQ